MQNIALLLAYDGTNYLGWQATQEGPSIEAMLQAALEQILQHPVHLQAASRTDAGVHASGQVVNFLSHKTTLLPERLLASLNALLPSDIAVFQVKLALPTFHPTLHCSGKEYHYFLCHSQYQHPAHRHYSWHTASLDLSLMQRAAPFFLGEQDFAAFCNVKKNETYTHTVRTITQITLEELPYERVKICMTGNHFLYKMVRNIVGTLVDVGKGKIALEAIPHILESRDRTLAGVTAPAHGLFLHSVHYKDSELL